MSSPRKETTPPELTFEQYATIAPETPFSLEHLRSITFNDLHTFRMPSIAPAGSVSQWVHIRDVPSDWVMDGDDVIPALVDIADMLKEMDAEYDNGYRGVTMRLRVFGKPLDLTASYRMVRVRMYFY